MVSCSLLNADNTPLAGMAPQCHVTIQISKMPACISLCDLVIMSGLVSLLLPQGSIDRPDFSNNFYIRSMQNVNGYMHHNVSSSSYMS